MSVRERWVGPSSHIGYLVSKRFPIYAALSTYRGFRSRDKDARRGGSHGGFEYGRKAAFVIALNGYMKAKDWGYSLTKDYGIQLLGSSDIGPIRLRVRQPDGTIKNVVPFGDDEGL